jgi:hypothetical protein
LLLEPKALSEACDIAISLRSAGSPDFNREAESLKSVREVDRLFYYGLNDCSMRQRKKLKSRDELRKEFQKAYVSNPEISLSIDVGILSLQYVHAVLVDSYWLFRKYLFNHVKNSARHHPGQLKYDFRRYKPAQSAILCDIANLLMLGDSSLDDLINNPYLATETREWAKSIKGKKDMDDQWRRYATYIRKGTLVPILEEQPLQSDDGLYKCLICDKLVMGFYKDEHVSITHHDRCNWKKIK